MGNLLKTTEMLKLADWMRANRGSVEGIGRKAAAIKAGDELGILITENNIQGIEEAIGFSCAREYTQESAKDAALGYCTAVALVELYKKLGHEVPGYLSKCIILRAEGMPE
jgi:hypothetical protein